MADRGAAPGCAAPQCLGRAKPVPRVTGLAGIWGHKERPDRPDEARVHAGSTARRPGLEPAPGQIAPARLVVVVILAIVVALLR
jgi:hypothetical protein